LVNARTLHFDSDLAAIVENRPMGLANGTRGDRGVLNRLKIIGHGARQVLPNERLHLARGYWLHRRLQAAEGFDVAGRQQVGAGAEQLAKFHIHRPQLGQNVAQDFRRGNVGLIGFATAEKPPHIIPTITENDFNNFALTGHSRRCKH
jgi:hypothetical protein